MARALGVAAVAALLNACATQTGTVVLLPEKDGKDAAVVVKQGEGQAVLREPYAAAKLTTAGPQAYQSNPQEVQALFGAALAAQPSRPVQFVLYFVEGKDELTDESKLAVSAVFAEIAKRPVPDVLVVGHTDAVGTNQGNDPLRSSAPKLFGRADPQRHRARITAVGRGNANCWYRRPMAAEPRNRRRNQCAEAPSADRALIRLSVRRRTARRAPLAGPGPRQRSARIVRSSAGSAPAAKAPLRRAARRCPARGRRAAAHPAQDRLTRARCRNRAPAGSCASLAVGDHAEAARPAAWRRPPRY
jgi:outer membrane protein OmpA-like peptidoglycan-associated protein